MARWFCRVNVTTLQGTRAGHVYTPDDP